MTPFLSDPNNSKAKMTVQGRLIQLEDRIEKLERALAGTAEEEGVDAKVKKGKEAKRVGETMDGAGSGGSDEGKDQDKKESSHGEEDGQDGDRETLRTITTNGTSLSQAVTQVPSGQEMDTQRLLADGNNENKQPDTAKTSAPRLNLFCHFNAQSTFFGDTRGADFARWHQNMIADLASMDGLEETLKIRYVAGYMRPPAYYKLYDHAESWGYEGADIQANDYGFNSAHHMLNYLVEQYDPDVSKIDMRFGRG